MDNDSKNNFKRLNIAVLDAIERHKNGMLTNEEYERVLLDIEKEMFEIKTKKASSSIKDFLINLIN